jgi:hypothetical protein
VARPSLRPFQPPEELVEDEETDSNFSRRSVGNDKDGMLTRRCVEAELPKPFRNALIWLDGI